MKKSHLFLKNEFGICLEFNRTRGRSDDEETLTEIKNYRNQKNRLYSCYESFHTAQSRRHSKRDPNLNIEHFDLFAIEFLKVADDDVVNSFGEKYGLSAVNYTDMNQTVLFAIADDNRFENVFITDVIDFYEEQNEENTKYKLLTLINKFNYWSSESIKSETVPTIDVRNILLETVEPSPRMISKIKSMKEAMNCFFKENNVSFIEIESGIYQINSIKEEQLEFLIDNYDIVQSVQALYNMRIRPNIFGNTICDADASLNLIENAPIIGVIDTGVHNIPVLEPILCEEGIDLVNPYNPKPYEIDLTSDSPHGTTVATLASFGNSFYENIKADIIEADARIYSIKVQSGDTGLVNISGIINAIRKANSDFNIKIFNLSMSVRCKNYNQDISVYAYLLDKLAYQLDILIFIAVGNLNEDDVRCIVDVCGQDATSEEIKHFLTYPNHYYNPAISTECHVCECMNLCEPSESMNNISVGAIAENFNPAYHAHGLSLGKAFPAYYSRKFHIDYNASINGTRFKNNQKNKNLFKPDIVMPGGDLLDFASRMLVLSPREDARGLRIIQNSGTSYATPLAANIAAKILCQYPELNMQSVKALIINSAEPINSHYLDDTISYLKKQENGRFPDVARKVKTELSKKFNADRLSKYISGHGVPNIAKCLESEDNRCTFVIEDSIAFNSHKVVNFNIPEYLLQYTKKDAVLELTATLCYKFNPIRSNALSYCPLHISFNFGNSMNHNDSNANAREYARTRASENKGRMAIKTDFETWSDDFYPASSKMFSNVQKKTLNITRDEIAKIEKQMAIVFRCTGRSELLDNSYPFSFVLTIEQKKSSDLEGHSLYDSIEQINTVQMIAETAIEINV